RKSGFLDPHKLGRRQRRSGHALVKQTGGRRGVSGEVKKIQGCIKMSSPIIFQDYAVDTVRPLRSFILHDQENLSGRRTNLRALWEHKFLLLGACLLAAAFAAIIATGVR